MKYAWISATGAWPISVPCGVLEVSVSGYLEHRAPTAPSRPPRRHLSDDALLVHIKAIHAEIKGDYGWPRIWKELLARGIRVGKERVQQAHAAARHQAPGKRKFKVTTDSNHDLPIAQTCWTRTSRRRRPTRSGASDITYIATDEGWLYLAVVIDLFSRQVVGWSMRRTCRPASSSMRCAWRGSGVIRARADLPLRPRQPVLQPGLPGRADRVRHAQLDEPQGQLLGQRPTREPVGSLKVGRLHGKRFATRRQAMDEVIDWLTFYNHRRLHSTLGYVSPMRFEANWHAAQAKKAA